MDYEKKYNEALERAKKFEEKYGGGYAEYIFPELTESEDERIRKAIIKSIKEDSSVYEQEVSKEQMLAYLKKQEIFSKGEGCYYYADGSYTFIGSMGFGPIEDIKINGERPKTENKGVDLPASVEINGLCVEKQKESLKDFIDDFPYSDEQKEQKPKAKAKSPLSPHELYDAKIEGISQGRQDVIDHPEQFGLQKPAEWNANDKAFIKDCARILDENGYTASAERLLSMFEQKPVQDREEKEYVRTLKSLIADFLYGKDEIDRGYYQKIYDWLDGRHIKQKPVSISCGHENDAEWSEEDEKIAHTILNLLCSQVTYVTGQGTTSGKQFPTYAKERDWFEKRFKSLRPSWKPSEEQIHAIIEALKYLPNNKDEWMVLNTLVDVLKKLMSL